MRAVTRHFSPLRALNTLRLPCLHRQYATAKRFDPLRILFCGSDEFSIPSLEALDRERRRNPDFIASVDLVCKRAVRVGRGRKTLRSVPVAETAEYLSIPIHRVDTFKGFEPIRGLHPDPINLVIAVSFGLLVPPRIFGAAKYGGLNVHPSMLPDFRGAAPLHHTLLQGCTHTGVSVQTLHPTHFDRGIVLAQTPPPGFEIDPSSMTVPELRDIAASKAADLLIQTLKNGLFIDLVDITKSSNVSNPLETIRLAPKIKPEDRHINWGTWTASEILRKHHVIGPLWNDATSALPDAPTKRIIWSSGFEPTSDDLPFEKPGIPFVHGSSTYLHVRTSDGKFLRISSAKAAASVVTDALHAAVKSKMLAHPGFEETERGIHWTFRDRLG